LAQLHVNYPPIKKPTMVLDQLHIKLKSYHDQLSSEISNVKTQKLTDEVTQVIEDVSQIDVINRPSRWSTAEQINLAHIPRYG